jgi:hypothetical protein
MGFSSQHRFLSAPAHMLCANSKSSFFLSGTHKV